MAVTGRPAKSATLGAAKRARPEVQGVRGMQAEIARRSMGEIPYAATDKFGLPANWSLFR